MADRTIEAKIYVEIPDGTEENAAAQMDLGLAQALDAFPAGTVIGAGVETIREPTEEEKSTHFEE